MSRINLSKSFVDLKNKSIENEGQLFTLKDAITQCLLIEFPNETPDAEDKVKRFKLAIKVNGATEDSIELSAEDISLIKKVIGKSFGALIVGQAFDFLENS